MTSKDLKQYRKQKGWTQADLADKIGVSVRTIQRIEQGIRDLDRTLKLALKGLQADKYEVE